ncbi:uncharacterized protein BN553_01593 [Firmicutes bacterium CAG:238]|nr:uncharacterized protein BN553_01593 [Firmicutes bacterium CAG:238]
METTTNIQAVEPKKNELRKLEAKDIAPVVSILSKIGLKEIKECFNPADLQELAKSGEEAATAVGLTVFTELAGVVFANYERCQDDIFRFLASLSGKSKEEIASLPMDSFAEMVIEVIKKEEFKDFFSVVAKLFK